MKVYFLVLFLYLVNAAQVKTQTLTTRYEGTDFLDAEGKPNHFGRSFEQDPAPNVALESICSGQFHSCGLDAQQNIHCWGKDWVLNVIIPNIPANTKFSKLACGEVTLCGLEAATGFAKCWGHDQQQDLVLPSPSVKFSSIASGSGVICGIKDSDKTLQCWGDQNQISKIPTNEPVDKIVLQYAWFCVLKPDGAVTCGGTAYDWDTGKTHDMAQSISKVSGKKFKDIVRSQATACGIEKSTDKLHCWGANGNKEIDDIPDVPVADVSNGYGFHICVQRKGDNKLVCWGKNNFNQVSDANNWAKTGNLMTKTLPITYAWVDSEGYGTCTKTCGGGTKTKSRVCKSSKGEVQTDTSKCGTDTGTAGSAPCNAQSCYAWADSDDYGTCTKSCGGGTKTKTRVCKEIGGTATTTDTSKCGTDTGTAASTSCNTQSCYAWADSDDYGTCQATCTAGTKTKSRVCKEIGGTATTTDTSKCGADTGTSASTSCDDCKMCGSILSVQSSEAKVGDVVASECADNARNYFEMSLVLIAGAAIGYFVRSRNSKENEKRPLLSEI